MVMGAGFAPFYGGLFSYADQRGITNLVRCHAGYQHRRCGLLHSAWITRLTLVLVYLRLDGCKSCRSAMVLGSSHIPCCKAWRRRTLASTRSDPTPASSHPSISCLEASFSVPYHAPRCTQYSGLLGLTQHTLIERTLIQSTPTNALKQHIIKLTASFQRQSDRTTY